MSTTPQQYIQAIDSCIGENRLRDAFVQLRALAARAADWRITEEIDRLEQTYRMMLDYASRGHADPGREDLYATITANIHTLADRAAYRIERRDSPTLYYSTLRYEAIQRDDSMRGLLQKYASMAESDSPFNVILGDTSADKKSAPAEREALARRIFTRLWVTFPLSDDIVAALGETFDSPTLPEDFKSLIISSLLLGLLEHYDEKRLNILFDIYGDPASNPRLAMQALCALLLAMYVNRRSLDPGRLRKRIASLRDTTTWTDDVRCVFMQFIRSRDTDRVTHTIADELMPRLQELRPKMKELNIDPDKLQDLQELMTDNPEWEEMMQKSGIADKLKELMKLQEEGADVMMPTFAQLKSFPFFNDIANWFLPFRPDHTAVIDALGNDATKIAGLIGAAPFLCDSDKYSFCFGVAATPREQRRVMLSQFNPDAISEIQLQQATNDNLRSDSAQERDNIAAKYVQALYRFFKLFRRKGEFNDPFSRPINLLALPLLQPDLHSPETLAAVGEFYFRHGYYADAAEVFEMLTMSAPADDTLFQKMGYAYQQTGNIPEAYRCYSQAELLNADSLWTRRRLGAVCRLLGHNEEALAHFRYVDSKRPDEPSIALNIGLTLLDLNRPKEAINNLFKAEYLTDPATNSKPQINSLNTRTLRALAWALLLTGDTTRSRSYYSRLLPSSADLDKQVDDKKFIIDDKKIIYTSSDNNNERSDDIHRANPDDFLHAGLAALLDRDIPSALQLLMISLRASESSKPSTDTSNRNKSNNSCSSPSNNNTNSINTAETDAWVDRFNSVLPKLYPLGLDRSLPPLIIDTLLYRLSYQ